MFVTHELDFKIPSLTKGVFETVQVNGSQKCFLLWGTTDGLTISPHVYELLNFSWRVCDTNSLVRPRVAAASCAKGEFIYISSGEIMTQLI